MSTVKLNLYRDDFNVTSNHGFLNRILRSIFVSLLALGLTILIPVSIEIRTLIFIAILIGGVIVSDKYFRRTYPDWPKSKNFIGTLNFSIDSISIMERNHSTALFLTECSEFVIFIDQYAGYTGNKRDVDRNGNGLFFYKDKLGQTSVYKFNVFNENQYNKLKIILDQYKLSIPYFKEYLPYEITHILKPDLSDRINYH
jgi:hypothetical protein